MAIATLTNTYTQALNVPEVGGSGVSPDAVGGNVLRPLPFPFNRNGSLASLASVDLPVRQRDLIVRQQPQSPSMPADELNNYIQRGWLSVSFAAETAAIQDVEDSLISAL